LTNITAISAGAMESVALKDDGTVWWWGDLPNSVAGGDKNVFKIVQVPITNVTSIYAGLSYVFAVKDDGTVWAWGYNIRGYLGNGDNNDPFVSGKVEVLPVRTKIYNITSIDAVGCFAVKDDGTVYAWGENTLITNGNTYVNGKLGDFLDRNIVPVPETVGMLFGVQRMSSGDLHVLVLKDDGTVWAWGTDYNGQLGDGGTVGLMDRNTGFQQIQSSLVKSKIDNVKVVSARFDQSMALKNDGTVWTWGSTPGSSYGSSTPAKVNGLSDVIAVSAGSYHYMALKSDGSVWAWGENDYGQAGYMNGGQSIVSSPVKMTFDDNNKMPDAVMIASSSLDLDYKSDQNGTSSVTPTPTEMINTPVPGSNVEAGNDDKGALPQGDGLVLQIAGVLIMIAFVVGVAILVKRK
jgi:alpha-tubulin suppressor-like RCC1 family protein